MAALESANSNSPDKKLEAKRKIVIVENKGALNTAARDAADSRLTASKEELKGFKGFAKKIWKHNLAHEYYRQKEIAKAKAEITGSKNLYAADGSGIDAAAHATAMQALTDRFSQEYEEAVHTEAGEERRTLSRDGVEKVSHAEIKNLIAGYAAGTIDEANFIEIRNGIVAAATGLSPDAAQSEVQHSDNLLEIAKQIKQSVEHGTRLEDIDLDFDVVIGKAKSGVRTEAQFNRVDRIVDKIQSTKIGAYINEGTLVSGIAIAYSLTAGLSQRFARSRAAAWGTFGLAALVGAGVEGARESKRLEDDRRQHFREMAQGKKFDPENAPRRTDMEQYRYQTESAEVMMASINGSKKEDLTNPEHFTAALGALADIEARIKLSDRKSIDLITYSDVQSVEQERLQLDIARAELKVALRNSVQSGAVQLEPGDTVESLLESRTNTAIATHTEGDNGIEEKNRLFSKMKRHEVGKAALKGLVTGLVIGGVVQEGLALLPGAHQQGFVKGVLNNLKGPTDGSPVTALEGLRLFLAGHAPDALTRMVATTAPDGTNMVLPEGMLLVAPNPSIPSFADLVHQDGTVTHGLEFKNGTLTHNSQELLQKSGVGVQEHVQSIVSHTPVEKTPSAYIHDHQSVFHHIRRALWYDNDTPAPVFDKNELKLHWGGAHGTGIGPDGQYTFNVAKMAPDGSYHGKFSVNAQEAMKHGHLKMLLSLSHDTQAQVVEIPIDAQGNAKIDPNSDIGKIFFKTEHGKAVFVGKFAEVGEVVGTTKGPDGGTVEKFRILATHGGKGHEYVLDGSGKVVSPGQPGDSQGIVNPGQVPDGKSPDLVVPGKESGPGINIIPDVADVPKTVPVTVIQEAVAHAGDYFVAPPPIIPAFGRRPLEPLLPPPYIEPAPLYYYGRQSPESRRENKNNQSPNLRNNPNANLNHYNETQLYLQKQDPEFLQKINELAAQSGAMDPACRTSICIPVAGHQEGEAIYSTLEHYLNQTANRDAFELALFVNMPDKDNNDNPVVADKTLSEIRRFQTDHPDMQVRVMNAVLPREEVRMGNIRKLLNDSVILRHHNRGREVPDLILVSNDADNKGLAPTYIQNFVEKFNAHPSVDAMMGQLDWDPTSYIRNPLAHVGIRLFQYIDVLMRSKNRSNIPSSGANFAFRSSIYAAVGGYSRGENLAEDRDFGQKIKQAREGTSRHIPIAFAGARASRLYTSSRRVERALADGLAPVEQWEKGFSAFDDEVRKVRWEDRGRPVNFEDPAEVHELVKQLENVINRSLVAMNGWPADQEMYGRALGWLGIKYEPGSNGEIRITDASSLIGGLRDYQNEGLKIMERKTAPVSGQPTSERQREQGNEDEASRQRQVFATRFENLRNDQPDYFSSLESDRDKLPPMDDACRTALVLRGGNQPQELLDGVLQQYAAQISGDPNSLEINVMISKVRPKAMAALEEWKGAHPDIKVNAIDINAQWYVDDLIALRTSSRSAQNYPLSVEWPTREKIKE